MTTSAESCRRVLAAPPPVVAYWTEDRQWEPQLAFDWSLEDCGEQLEEACGVPLEAWIELARSFAGSLKDERSQA